MSFKKAIDTTSVASCYQPGLQALGAHSTYVSCSNTRLLEGSVDIDGCLAASLPYAARWDYVIGYKAEAYFIEIHPANTSEVDTVIKKALWLLNWLKKDAPALNIIRHNPLYWIASGKTATLPNSPQARRLSASGISLKSRLDLK